MGLFSRRPLAEFYDLYEEAAANAARSAELLHEMLDEFPDDGGHAREILLCEQTGDRITHAILRLLGEGAKPPMPSPLAHKLATDIDDVVDLIEQVSDCFVLYKIEAPMDPSLELAGVLVESTKALVGAVATMRSGSNVKDAIIRVHQLENEGDKLSREAIASLFAGGVDPMVVIRWKDIFEQMEHAIDACEHVAHTLEGGSYGA